MSCLFYLFIFLCGILIGSFLNMCIYNILSQRNIITIPSHCTHYDCQLKWYNWISIFSWLFLDGGCKKCKRRLSIQYPLIKFINGILWVSTFTFCGFSWDSMWYSLTISALLVISIIDFRTFEIPFGINVFLFIIGGVRLVFVSGERLSYLAGSISVSGFLLFLYFVTKRKAIGGGDIKLMAAAGLLIGWQFIITAFLLGCLYGSVIHLLRMKISGQGHLLALGPYLSMGILTAIWFGNSIINWYKGI